jgi:hypothetical protein
LFPPNGLYGSVRKAHGLNWHDKLWTLDELAQTLANCRDKEWPIEFFDKEKGTRLLRFLSGKMRPDVDQEAIAGFLANQCLASMRAQDETTRELITRNTVEAWRDLAKAEYTPTPPPPPPKSQEQMAAEAQARKEKERRGLLDSIGAFRLSELGDAGPSEFYYIWDGLIAVGHITLLAAQYKAGKSTLIGHLLRKIQDGNPFFGRPTQSCKVMVVSEEKKGIWEVRKAMLSLNDEVIVCCQPYVKKPTVDEWATFVGKLRRIIEQEAIDLLVIDTIGDLSPWTDENSAPQVTEALAPLRLITELGCAILLIHHLNKSDNGDGLGIRGSTAIAASADVLVELRRADPKDYSNRRRILKAIGRFPDVPAEIVAELSKDGTGYDVVAAEQFTPATHMRADAGHRSSHPSAFGTTRGKRG